MRMPSISFEEGERVLDWMALTDAPTAGHRMPRAEGTDSFLYRGLDTLLTRSAWIDGLGIAVKAATIFPGNPDRGLDLDAFARAPEDITLFKNGDGAHLDLMTARHILTAWRHTL